jgi:hypothetical protein
MLVLLSAVKAKLKTEHSGMSSICSLLLLICMLFPQKFLRGEVAFTTSHTCSPGMRLFFMEWPGKHCLLGTYCIAICTNFFLEISKHVKIERLA